MSGRPDTGETTSTDTAATSQRFRGLRKRLGTGAAGPAGAASKRALLTTADQAFSSASNFVVGVAVARIAGPQGLGGFALAYGCWLILAAMHRSLVTDPMAIENDAIQPDAPARLRRGFAQEVTLALGAAAALAVVGVPLFELGQRTFGLALLAVIPWLPFLLVQDYWRWTGFMRREPGKSLANDTVFNVVQGTCFVLVALGHVHSVVAVIASWGAGAAAGALYGLWQFKVRPTMRGGVNALRVRWHLSKWLAGNSLMGWAASQASVLLAGFILGPAGLGALRAAQTLVQGPALVLIQAGGSVGLPEASRALADRGWGGLRRVSFVVSAAGVASIAIVGAAVVLFGGPLLRITYGPEFSRYWPAAEFFALGFLVSTIGLGPILILKTTRNTRWLFRVQVITACVSIAVVVVLAITEGVPGAAAASIASSIANILVLTHYSRKAKERLIHSEGGDFGENGSEVYENGPGGPGSADSGSGAAGTNGAGRDAGNVQPGRLPHIDQIRNNDAPIVAELG
jgi:O-antigen/teichoic acid export membrane protein